MYILPPSDYTLSDIERFCELTLRKGSQLESVRKTPDDERVVVGAWVLGLSARSGPEELSGHAARFLAAEGSWLAEQPAVLIERALALGLIEKEGERYSVRQHARDGVTRRRLIDEIEAARSIMNERRERMRRELQARNREVNRPQNPWVRPEEDERWMAEALDEARLAAQDEEVPVGAVLVLDGEIIARAGNRTRTDCDPTAHAEMLVIREAAKKLSNYRLERSTLYVTLEPCPMCAGALVQARVGRVVFAAADPKMGAMGGAFDLGAVEGINHRPLVEAGCGCEAARALLQTFFSKKRSRAAQ